MNAHGQTEATTLARRLRDVALAAVYTSPLERARQTAQAIAIERAGEPIVSEYFTELDFGAWTGRTFAELANDEGWQRFNQFRSGTIPPGGEAALDVLARARAGLQIIGDEHPGQVVAIVTHADVIRTLVTWAAGAPLDLLLRFDVRPVSTTSLLVQPWGPTLLGVNHCGELPPFRAE